MYEDAPEHVWAVLHVIRNYDPSEPENYASQPECVHRLVVDHYDEAMSYLEKKRQEAESKMAEHHYNRIRALEKAAEYKRMAAAYELMAAFHKRMAVEGKLRADLQAAMNTDEEDLQVLLERWRS
jgi:hypothetical protein